MLKHSLIAFAAMGAGLIAFSGPEASAVTVQKQAVQQAGESSLLTPVHRRRGHHHGRYRHGISPWWVLPFVGAGIALSHRDRYYDSYSYGYGGSHVEWCLSRYRSYNIRTNTWVSYSGHVHQCISPYGP